MAGIGSTKRDGDTNDVRAIIARMEDDTDVALGDVLQRAPSTFNDGADDVKQPEVEDGLLGNFVGIAAADVKNDAHRAFGAYVSGVCQAKVIGATTAVVGRQLIPTNDQDYLTGTDLKTGIELLTDLTADTDVHVPNETESPPYVRLSPPFGVIPNQMPLPFRIVDLSTAEDVWSVAPCNCELVGGYIIQAADITVADTVVTVSDGTTTAGTFTVLEAGGAAGTVTAITLSATVANRRFTAGEKIKIACDGGGTTTSVGTGYLLVKEW